MEVRYPKWLEAVLNVMIVVNEISNILLLNLRAESMFGYLRNELLRFSKSIRYKTVVPSSRLIPMTPGFRPLKSRWIYNKGRVEVHRHR